MEYGMCVHSKHVLFCLRLPDTRMGFNILFRERVVHWFRNSENYDPGHFRGRAKGLQHGVRLKQ